MNATATTNLDAPIWENCGRCGGAGSVSWGAPVTGLLTYTDGRRREVPQVCFICNGVGGSYTTQRKLNRREKDRARRAVKRETEAAARAAEAARQAEQDAAETAAHRAAWEAANPGVVTALAALTGDFADDLRETLQDTGELTEKQAAAAVRIAADKAAEPAPAPVVEGRVEIAGKVIATKWVDGYAYSSPDVLKIVVLDDRGFKVYGTAPKSLGEIARGDRVTFTAAVTASDDDEAFGFFKRPTKAHRIES